MVFEVTSPYEKFSLIAGLSSKKSSGPDDIRASILKSINYPLRESHALSWIINKSLSSEIYLVCLKVAKVIPLFKGGDASNHSNFRSNSLLYRISKILEKVSYYINDSQIFLLNLKFLLSNNMVSEMDILQRWH